MKISPRFLFLLLFLASVCFAVPTRSHAVNAGSPNLKKFEPYLGRYSNSWIYDGRELRGTIAVTKVLNDRAIEITMRTETDKTPVEVSWLIDLDTQSKKLPVKHITPMEPNGTTGYQAYFKGRDLLLERTFHEKDGTWNVMRFHWRLMNANQIQIITEHQYQDGKTSTSLIFNLQRLAASRATKLTVPHAPPNSQ